MIKLDPPATVNELLACASRRREHLLQRGDPFGEVPVLDRLIARLVSRTVKTSA